MEPPTCPPYLPASNFNLIAVAAPLVPGDEFDIQRPDSEGARIRCDGTHPYKATELSGHHSRAYNGRCTDVSTNVFIKQCTKGLQVFAEELANLLLLPQHSALAGLIGWNIEKQCLVFQTVEGTQFRSWIAREPPRELVMYVAFRVALAIQFLHHHGLSHGDIWGPNVIVQEGGMGQMPNPVLIDFGHAQRLTDENLRTDWTQFLELFCGLAELNGFVKEIPQFETAIPRLAISREIFNVPEIVEWDSIMGKTASELLQILLLGPEDRLSPFEFTRQVAAHWCLLSRDTATVLNAAVELLPRQQARAMNDSQVRWINRFAAIALSDSNSLEAIINKLMDAAGKAIKSLRKIDLNRLLTKVVAKEKTRKLLSLFGVPKLLAECQNGLMNVVEKASEQVLPAIFPGQDRSKMMMNLLPNIHKLVRLRIKFSKHSDEHIKSLHRIYKLEHSHWLISKLAKAFLDAVRLKWPNEAVPTLEQIVLDVHAEPQLEDVQVASLHFLGLLFGRNSQSKVSIPFHTLRDLLDKCLGYSPAVRVAMCSTLLALDLGHFSADDLRAITSTLETHLEAIILSQSLSETVAFAITLLELGVMYTQHSCIRANTIKMFSQLSEVVHVKDSLLVCCRLLNLLVVTAPPNARIAFGTQESLAVASTTITILRLEFIMRVQYAF